MIERVFEKLYWADRDSVIRNKLALFLGQKLCSGCSLSESFTKASEEIDNIEQKKALLKVANIIKKSEKADKPENNNEYQQIENTYNNLKYALSDGRLELRQKDRYILASSLPNELKGAILKNWSSNKYNGSNAVSYLFIILTTIFLCVSLFLISLFVLPQYYVICLGINFPLKDLINALYHLSSSGGIFLILFLFLGFILFLIIFTHFFNNIGVMQEEADLLAVLSSVKREDQWKILDILSNRYCFPRIHRLLRKAINNMEKGENQDDCFENTALSSYAKWFLHLSFFENDRVVLKEGSMILNERIMLSSISAIKITEVLVVIVQSLFFALIAYILYGSLNSVVAGVMVA